MKERSLSAAFWRARKWRRSAGNLELPEGLATKSGSGISKTETRALQ